MFRSHVDTLYAGRTRKARVERPNEKPRKHAAKCSWQLAFGTQARHQKKLRRMARTRPSATPRKHHGKGTWQLAFGAQEQTLSLRSGTATIRGTRKTNASCGLRPPHAMLHPAPLSRGSLGSSIMRLWRGSLGSFIMQPQASAGKGNGAANLLGSATTAVTAEKCQKVPASRSCILNL